VGNLLRQETADLRYLLFAPSNDDGSSILTIFTVFKF